MIADAESLLPLLDLPNTLQHLDLAGRLLVPHRMVGLRIRCVSLPLLHSDDHPFAQGTYTHSSGSLAPSTPTTLSGTTPLSAQASATISRA